MCKAAEERTVEAFRKTAPYATPAMVARIMYRQLGKGCGPLSRCAQPKMNAAASSVRTFAPKRSINRFWISERKRISSGSAVPTKMMPTAELIRPADWVARCGRGTKPMAFPTTASTGATIAHAASGRVHAAARAAAPLKTALSIDGATQILAGLRCSVSFRNRLGALASNANMAASNSARTAICSIELSCTQATLPGRLRDPVRLRANVGQSGIDAFGLPTNFFPGPRLRQPRPHQQRVGVRVAAHESTIQFRRVLAIALRQYFAAESGADLAAEDAAIAETRKRVGLQHLRPFIGVIAGAVTHRRGEQVREGRDHGVCGGQRGGTGFPQQGPPRSPPTAR